jgi:hypothetical protein
VSFLSNAQMPLAIFYLPIIVGLGAWAYKQFQFEIKCYVADLRGQWRERLWRLKHG